jgi:rhodanese-related sulfurtransferase
MAAHPDDLEVSPERTAELLREGAAQVVDVREDDEHAAGHVAGAAHVPLGELTERAAAIDRDRPVVFLCRVGGRSLMAAQAFRAAGYEAWSMAGGLEAWNALGLPLEPDDGYVAGH